MPKHLCSASVTSAIRARGAPPFLFHVIFSSSRSIIHSLGLRREAELRGVFLSVTHTLRRSVTWGVGGLGCGESNLQGIFRRACYRLRIVTVCPGRALNPVGLM